MEGERPRLYRSVYNVPTMWQTVAPFRGEMADHGPGLPHSVNLQSECKMVSNFVHALSGLILLDNVRPLDGLPSSVMFDSRM